MKPQLRGFALGALLLLGAALGLRCAIAHREWFYSDDFFFLGTVRDHHFRWLETFLPTHSRVIPAYRPLGLDGYFFANFALFGWNAFGYYMSALAVQLATAFMVVRIARHYALDRRAAWAGGLFALLAGPSCVASYEVAEHNYLCAALGSACSIAWFLDDLARPRVWLRWLSCLALLFALLSNEVCASLPLVACLAAALAEPQLEPRARVRRALLASWPQILVAGLYVDFKFSGVPMRQDSWFYDVDISSDMLSNTLGNLAYVTGGQLRLFGLALAALLLLGWRVRAGGALRLDAHAFAPAAVGGAWLLLTLLPFSVLALPASRFGLVQLPAAGLLFATLLDAALGLAPAQLGSWLTLAALALLTPWADMLLALRAPRGAIYRDAYAVLARELPESDVACVTVLCDGPELASDAQCEAFKDGTFNGALLRAIVVNQELPVEFRDRRTASNFEATAGSEEAPECVRYYLKPDMTLSREAPATNATARVYPGE
jgi:hypothetical protein